MRHDLRFSSLKDRQILLPIFLPQMRQNLIAPGSELTKIIDRTVQNHKVEEIVTLNLAEKTTFSWDTLYVFTSGSFEYEMNEAMNIQYFQRNTEVPDRHSWILFKDKNKIVRKFELSIGEYDFSDLGFHNGELMVPRDSAIFRVKKLKPGSPIILFLEYK